MTAEPMTMFYDEPIRDDMRWMRPALMSSDSEEWYTPAHLRERIIEALGGRVDLDPCADPGKTFPAANHFTPVENGLARRWVGRVYMNPPYGRETPKWTTKLRDELTAGWTLEAVVLVPVRTDTGWWQDLRPMHWCAIRGRLRFNDLGPAPFPSAAMYFGPEPERFREAFRGMGLFYAGDPR